MLQRLSSRRWTRRSRWPGKTTPTPMPRCRRNRTSGGVADAFLCAKQMSDPIESNGDPLFYLHHAYLDRVWWQWQEANLTARLTDISAQNIPDQSILDIAGLSAPVNELTDYNGDNGNVTTLNHVLFIQNLVPNVTIADIMDIRGDVVSAEYVD